VFVRKPNHLFQLEEAREKEYPRCAILIQKTFRRFKARKHYRRLLAGKRILQWIRKSKSKKYMNELIKSFAGVDKRADLGKSAAWPKLVPVVLKAGAENLKKIYRKWRLEKVQRALGP
jgi:myosin heavy subunit